MIDDRCAIHVAPGTTQDTTSNVLVLAGVDIELPLEADLDGDPLHDDEVRLEGADGSLRTLTADDPDVRLAPDRRLHLYRFCDVPAGIYSLSAKLSDGTWAPIMTGLVVTKAGVRLGGDVLADRDAPAVPEDAPRVEPAEPEPVPEEFRRALVDVTPGVFERR